MATGHIERWPSRRRARPVRRRCQRPSGARLVSSVAIVSVVWFTSTSWRHDQICEPYRKVSQNRSISDRVGVVEALEREAVPSGTTIAALIRETLDGGD